MEDDVAPEKLSKKFHKWFHKHLIAIIVIIFSCVACIAIVLSAAINVYQREAEKPVQITYNYKKPAVIPKYYSPLTGALVNSEADTKLPVTGVMIENSPEARPQSGLKNSGIVFEAIAEGGITRFLVLYQSEKPQMIGPVRSLRLYDVDWLAAFDAGICHVGGSAAALTEIRNGSYRDLDQFFNSTYYWRATDRYAPHNVYTSFANIDNLNTKKQYSTSTFTGFNRADDTSIRAQDATKIDIIISSALFNSSYVYDKNTKAYARYQAGAPHLDRESGQISPTVVIALHVEETKVMEDGWRESIKTIGSGKADIFQNGNHIATTWTKDSKTSQIKFTDESGKEVSLARGQTWIAAVPEGSGSVSWQ